MLNIILPVSYFLSGFFMKFSDDEYDDNNNTLFAIVLGIICGVFVAIATLSSVDACHIFLGILIGNLLALKIDGKHHVATLLTFFIILAVFGVPQLNSFLLLIIIFGAWIDEWGNDNPKIYNGGFLEYFFDYRCGLKVVILVLAIFGFLSFYSFVYFLLFEFGYELARILFSKYLVV